MEHSENKIITQSGLFQNMVGAGLGAPAQRSTNTSAAKIPKAQTICNRLCVVSVLIISVTCRLYVC